MVLQNTDDYLKDILEDCKANLAKIRISLESEIKKFPSILGNNLNIYFSSDLVKIFLKSKSLINEFNDSFISPEILIYSILNCDNLVIYDLLVKNGLNKESFKKSIIKIRKGQTIDTSNKSINSNSLRKFSINVTDLANKGKLDPVIEEEEIRRSIQVSLEEQKIIQF